MRVEEERKYFNLLASLAAMPCFNLNQLSRNFTEYSGGRRRQDASRWIELEDGQSFPSNFPHKSVD